VTVVLPAEVADGMSLMDTGYAALLVAIAERCAADLRIRALAVSGSVARHDADRHSDLDLTLVVTEGRRAEVAADAVPLLQRCCEVVDLRWVGPRIVSAVTSQWLRVDLILAEATGDRCTLHGDHVMVFDNLGVEFGPPPALRLDPVGLTAQISRFMRSVGLVVRDLHRGDFRLCCFAVEFLVDELVTLMYQSQGLARGGKKGAYEHLPDTDVDVLQTLPVAVPERQSIIDAHLAVAEAYLSRARKLVAASGAAEWPSAMEEATRRFS
jgi:predicted nucleotidyltransferase